MRYLEYRGKNQLKGWMVGRLHVANMMKEGDDRIMRKVFIEYPLRDDRFPGVCSTGSEAVAPHTVTQALGRYDCENQKIFEGDVLEDKRGRRYMVEYDDERLRFVLRRRLLPFMRIYKSIAPTIKATKRLRIVGNRFDVPGIWEVKTVTRAQRIMRTIKTKAYDYEKIKTVCRILFGADRSYR